MAVTSLDSRLDAIGRTQPGLSELLPKLERFVRESPDSELDRVNALRWAKEHGVEEHQALELFLRASAAGVFDLQWVLMCPLCGLYVSTRGALQQLTRHATCAFCRRPVSIALDDTVEVVFTVAAAVRKLEPRPLGTIEQVRKHFVAEFYARALIPTPLHDRIASSMQISRWLPTGETTTLELNLEPGTYVLCVPHLHAIAHLETSENGTSELAFEVLDGQIVGAAPLKPGPVKIVVRNRTPKPVLALWGSTSWTKTFDWTGASAKFAPQVSAKQLLTNQTFRELYRAEGVGTDGGMQLRSLAILFTDLTASTELYERVGDLKALDLVRRHFEVLQGVIAAEHGAVVKTIGDAVMASFAEPDRALAAAAAMHRQMAKLGASEELTLKIGVHVGSCVAIESNQQLDFFGRTVNVAARVQAKAGAGDVVITREVLEHPSAREVAKTQFTSASEERVHLKGIEGEVEVHRLRVS
jgi:class 3 adenylate cyclase